MAANYAVKKYKRNLNKLKNKTSEESLKKGPSPNQMGYLKRLKKQKNYTGNINGLTEKEISVLITYLKSMIDEDKEAKL